MGLGARHTTTAEEDPTVGDTSARTNVSLAAPGFDALEKGQAAEAH